MNNRIEKYLIDRTQDLVFITIDDKGEINLPNFEIPHGGFKIPVKSSVLVKTIKEEKENENLNMTSMVDAALYLQGIDSNFVYTEDYDRFIDAFSEKTGFNKLEFLGYMSTKSYEEGEVTDSLIYIRSYLRNKEDVDALYQYAIICQEMSLRYQKDGDEKAMNVFLLEALDSLEKIIDIDESFSLAYYQLGFHYLNQKQFLKAKLVWEKSLDLGIEDDLVSEVQENLQNIGYKVKYEKGYNLVFQGKAEEGLKFLLPLEKEHPDWWNLLFIISLAYKSIGDVGEAKFYLEKILVMKPTQVDTLVEIALLCAGEGNLEMAIDYLSKAAKIKKDNPEILCNLGMAYLNLGDYDEAKYYIERAYEIDPTDEVTLACLNQL